MRTWREWIILGTGLIMLIVGMLALAFPAVGEAAPTGAISGTVTAAGGAALESAFVCAESLDEEDFGCEETDEFGEYEIAGLAAGQYTVEFRSPRGTNYVRQLYDGASSRSTATPVTVSAGTTKTGIDAVLEPGAKISGFVTAAATGLPVDGVEVCAVSIDETSFGCGETGGSGSYSIEGLAEGEYEIYFYAYSAEQNLLSQPYPGLVFVAAAGARTGINVALQTGGQVSGTVRLAATGGSVSGVRVCLTEAAFSWPLACLTTPKSGAYRFDGIWTGSFKVAFSPEASELFSESEPGPEESWADAYPTQWWNGQPSFATATPIAITAPATVGGIDGSLGPPAAVPPATTTTPPPAVSTPVTKSVLECHRGFLKRKVHGKQRCVKRHKPKHHRVKRHKAARNRKHSA